VLRTINVLHYFFTLCISLTCNKNSLDGCHFIVNSVDGAVYPLEKVTKMSSNKGHLIQV